MRVITRLDETCREVRDAARVIGDAELFKKMEEAQNKIKRDSECKLKIKSKLPRKYNDRTFYQLYSQRACISEWGRATFVRLEESAQGVEMECTHRDRTRAHGDDE